MDANTKRCELCKQSRAPERIITIGKTESRRAGTGGRCMDFLRAILCANSKRDDNQRLLLLIMTVGSIGRQRQQVHKLETVGDIKKSRSR